MKQIIFICVCLIIWSGSAVAQAPSNSNKPIEIEADQTLEWLRDQKVYIARGNAVATQGTLTLKGDILTAHYEEAAAGSTEIKRITIEGNVHVTGEAQQAFGDSGSYDIETGEVVLEGKNLKITTPTEKITAERRLEYNTNEKVMKAHGGAKVTRGQDHLNADTLVANFSEDAQGKLTLHKINATGHVVLRNLKETVKSDHAIYNVSTGKAVLNGSVRILQGSSWLEGAKAEVDLKTGVSQLFAGQDNNSSVGTGRVRGIFYPKTQTKN